MNITLTCVPGGIPPVVHCTQYDNAFRNVVAKVDITDCTGNVSSCTAWLYAKKPDGTIHLTKEGVSVTISSTYVTVTVTLNSQLTAASGKADCVIAFVDGASVIGIAPFVLDISPNPYNPDGIISTDVFEGAMQEAISTYVEEHAEEIFENAGETITGMRADITTNASGISQLKSDIVSITGNEIISLDKNTCTSIESPLNQETYSGWSSAVVSCSPGDKFSIKGYGGNLSRLWMFATSSGSVLTSSVAYCDASSDFIFIVAPANAAWLSVNNDDSKAEMVLSTNIIVAADNSFLNDSVCPCEEWYHGGMISSLGNEWTPTMRNTSTTRISTNAVKIGNVDKIHLIVPDGFKYVLAQLDSSNIVLDYSGWVNGTGFKSIDVVDNAVSIGLVLAYTDDSVILPDAYDSITVYLSNRDCNLVDMSSLQRLLIDNEVQRFSSSDFVIGGRPHYGGDNNGSTTRATYKDAIWNVDTDIKIVPNSSVKFFVYTEEMYSGSGWLQSPYKFISGTSYTIVFAYADNSTITSISDLLSNFDIYYDINLKAEEINSSISETQDAAYEYPYKIISILGDSISTFGGSASDEPRYSDGTYTYAGNRCRYPQSDLLTDVNLTYWMRLINKLGLTLGINESWAGSRVSWDGTTESTDIGANKHIASATRIGHLGENGTPSIILVNAGTNDIGGSVTVGTFNTESPMNYTDAQIAALPVATFADAYRTMLIRLQKSYPTSKIIVLLPNYTSSYYTPTKEDEYCEVIKEACDYFGVKWYDMRTSGVTMFNRETYLPDGTHYNASGMDLLYKNILKDLKYDFSL